MFRNYTKQASEITLMTFMIMLISLTSSYVLSWLVIEIVLAVLSDMYFYEHSFLGYVVGGLILTMAVGFFTMAVLMICCVVKIIMGVFKTEG